MSKERPQIKAQLTIDSTPISLKSFFDFLFNNNDLHDGSVDITEHVISKVKNSRKHLELLIEKKIPVYGVTTGFGASCKNIVGNEQSIQLQKNLINYLNCGTGDTLPPLVSKAALALRLISLCRGYSGVRTELIFRMKFFLERNFFPVIPSEGSLGASGDLVPLSYLAMGLIGEGELWTKDMIGSSPFYKTSAESAFKKAELNPKYKNFNLDLKEGIALVNGTSAMLGLAMYNLKWAERLFNLSQITTFWAVLGLQGRPEAFSEIVNEQGSGHLGQIEIAKNIRNFLSDENYKAPEIWEILAQNKTYEFPIQDKYSIRCVPQILGPVFDTIQLVKIWLEREMNSSSDNPLMSSEMSNEQGEQNFKNFANGGNFYGGFLSQGMDYLKISLMQVADMIDRQILLLMDKSSNRGLPENLSGVKDAEQIHAHHGLKGLHQLASALTSEIAALSIPNSIFSRSSENHNQDKVSLGMSSAVQCLKILEKLNTLVSIHLIVTTQALDLREVRLKGSTQNIYEQIRKSVSFVSFDRSLQNDLLSLSNSIRELTNSTWDQNAHG